MNRRTGAQLEQTGAAGGLEGLGFCSSAPVAPVPLGTENWSGANGPGEKLNPTTCELASKSLAAAQSRRNAVASFVPRPQIRLPPCPPSVVVAVGASAAFLCASIAVAGAAWVRSWVQDCPRYTDIAAAQGFVSPCLPVCIFGARLTARSMPRRARRKAE
jgi:hypothetical protein